MSTCMNTDCNKCKYSSDNNDDENTCLANHFFWFTSLLANLSYVEWERAADIDDAWSDSWDMDLEKFI